MASIGQVECVRAAAMADISHIANVSADRFPRKLVPKSNLPSARDKVTFGD
jgi:hypothetical protein